MEQILEKLCHVHCKAVASFWQPQTHQSGIVPQMAAPCSCLAAPSTLPQKNYWHLFPWKQWLAAANLILWDTDRVMASEEKIANMTVTPAFAQLHSSTSVNEIAYPPLMWWCRAHDSAAQITARTPHGNSADVSYTNTGRYCLVSFLVGEGTYRADLSFVN